MIPCNRMKTIISLLLLLAVVKLIHCQDHEQMIVLTLQGILQNLESINGQLKDMQEKLQHVENNLQDVHQELGNQKTNFQDMQEKLQHLEDNLQDVQQEQGIQKTYFQGLSRETAQCLKEEDLEHLTNVSTAANQEIKSFHKEMSEVIAWSRKDECLEGGLPCGEIGTCENTLFNFTCSCPSGFTWDGSECEDVDECAEGKDDCVPNATCKNSIGSYSCSCNEHFEGDGRTSCEFQCRSPAETVTGLGCIMRIRQNLSFNDGKKKCEEEGGRLAQHMTLRQLQNIGRSPDYLGWAGVYDGKWISDGSLVPEDLWWKGYRSDPSRPCGIISTESSPPSYKFYQMACSGIDWGYCQFPMP